MDTLAPNATVEEIEAEIAFMQVMLQTLDPADVQFESTQTQYETTLIDLHRRLDLINGPLVHAPSTPTHLRTSRNEQHGIHLPSRERVHPTIHTPSKNSPLGNRSIHRVLADGARVSGAALNPVDSSPTLSPRNNKRPYDGWSFGGLDGQNSIRKMPRLEHSRTPSTTSTSATSDSLELLDSSLAQHHGLNLNSTRDSIMKRIKEQQMQAELRIKREREDAEFARALQQASQSFSSSSSTQQRTQSYFDGTGQVKRELPSTLPHILSGPSTVESSPPLRQVKPEMRRGVSDFSQNSMARRALQAAPSLGVYQRNTKPGAAPSQPVSSNTLQGLGMGHENEYEEEDDDDDDDDFEEISQAQFTAKRRIQSPDALPFSSYSSMNNVWGIPATVNRSNGYLANGYVPTVGQNPMLGGTSVYNNPPNLMQTTQSMFNSALASAQSAAASAVGGWWDEFNSVAGIIGSRQSHRSNPVTMGNHMNLVSGGSHSLQHRALDFDADMHARGLDYMLNDPARTREELEQLLENIRPDEDIPPEMRIGTPEALNIPLMEHQKLGLAWLKAQEEGSNKGGILADDMGLGKTIQALSLIVSRPSEDRARRTTLIIAPVALLRQWREEIDEKIRRGHKLKVYIFHGSKPKDTFATLSAYDVVLTTFGKVAGEYGRKEAFRLRRKDNPGAVPRPAERLVLLSEEARWYRVIIDEAQCIKNKSTKAALGASHLNSLYRLCMTGTPMMNNVGELYSLIHFLRIPPYNELERFNHDFKKPLSAVGGSQKERAMKTLQALLKAILLRRTKKSEIDGRPILNLPERTTEIVHAVFDDDQQAFYTALETETQLAVNKYLQKGKMGRNYSYILVRLLRLRQACCHPHLIKDFAEDGPGDIPVEDMRKLAEQLDANVVARIKSTNGNFECPICYDATENPTIFFPCGHDVCSECFTKITDPAQAIANGVDGSVEAKCPECRSKVDPKRVINWSTFKKIHLPEQCEDDEGEVDEIKDEADASDTESEFDDSNDESDTDSNGDLRNFIVNDDEEEEEDEENEGDDGSGTESVQQAKLEGSDEVQDHSKRQRKQKGRSTLKLEAKDKSRGKVKWKGKARAKAKQKEKKTMAQLKQESLRNAKAKKRYLRRIRRNWISSAKIDKTVEVLRMIQEHDPEEKTIIFSQFTSLLDLLEVAIDEGGWRYRRYDGSMSAALRDEAVTDFKRTANIKVMLVSLKAGNAGLNLTAASQVIILDPFWNPFIEEQAIDRAHRIGQRRPVQVHRILVENTVEDRIIMLQEKKRDLINQALDEKAGQSLSRLGRAELAYLFGITPTVQANLE